jgi:LPPG:FO 2-phospho-L-lactate transferase
MRITVLAGGVGAARFLRGLRAVAPDAHITVIGNTGDDISLFGLHVSPDLDTVMYTLGGGISEEQGWGRAGDTYGVLAELAAYHAGPDWFQLGDKDFATHIARTSLLAAGQPLSAATATLCQRWQPGVTLIPMSDDPRCPLPPSGMKAPPRHNPHPGCWTPSPRPTWCCSRRPTRW